MMVLIRGEDKTGEIETIRHDSENRKIHITYRNSVKEYSHNPNSVIILENPKIIAPNGQAAYVNGILIENPKLILEFESHVRIIQDDGTACTIRRELFSAIKNIITAN